MAETRAERSTLSAVAQAPLDQWITRLRLIPEKHRQFDVDLNRAKLEFGIDMDLAYDLIARGLPHTVSASDPCFAATDLHYIGLRLGCATTHLSVLQTWASGLRTSADGESTSVEVLCAPRAARGTTVDVLVGPEQRAQASIGADRIAARIRAVTVTQWPAVSAALKDVLVDLACMEFCWIPESLAGHVEFTRHARLSDCRNAALLLSTECERLGIASRMAYGLLLATPLSTPHTWVEIGVGDRWVPIDPLLIGLLTQHAALDASVWPPVRSPGGVLLRLADRETPIVLADGRPLQASFLTRMS